MVTIKTIIDWFSAEEIPFFHGEKAKLNQKITKPRAIDCAKSNHITFINNKFKDQFQQLIYNTQSKIIIIKEDFVNESELKIKFSDIVFIVSSNPKKDLLELFKAYFFQNQDSKKNIINNQSQVSSLAIIGDSVSIGAFTVIEDNVKIGDDCVIGPNTIIKSDTVIGNNVIIGSNNVIGGVGFGYVKDEETNEYDQFPHLGKTIIEDNVHIGNNTCIDRGSLKDTIIRSGVKIDNLVHISHNVEIGKNSLIIACTMIAGSVTIGENSWLAPSSSIRNSVSIGKNVTVGLASTVTKNIDEDKTIVGSPGMPLNDFTALRKYQREIIKKVAK
jgi:UDP-3-O-[3-hydroxymyristoyl] glucosamine N-acyltransferase